MKITATNIIKIRKPKVRYPVITPISDRFSPRNFSNEKISEKDLNSIFEAARLTPSARNYQPWFFYWTRNTSETFKKIISCFPESNYWAKTASVLIISCYEPQYENIDNPYALYDLGASVLSLVLQAQHLGFYARQIGHFDKEKLVKVIKINKNQKPFIVVAIGKIGDYSKIEKEFLDKDIALFEKKTNIVKEI